MRRLAAVAGTALFLALAPGILCGLVPWWITRWRFRISGIAWLPLQIFGAALIAAGAAVVLDSFARFALQGVGTPAPVFPTRRLIVTGFYRYVRNPMYVAVVAIILGQGLLFGNLVLLGYGALGWLVCHLFVVLYEEPTLRSSFGADYESFRAAVPRWVPRKSPWPDPHGSGN